MEEQEKEITAEAEKPVPAEKESAELKFNPAFLASFAAALLIFFITLCFGRVLYGLAAFAFVGICAQFVEFYLKLKRKTFIVTASLSGVAALALFILAIVALCVG